MLVLRFNDVFSSSDIPGRHLTYKMPRFDHLLTCNNEKSCLSIKFDNSLGIDDTFR